MVVGLLALFTWCTVWSAYETLRQQQPQHRVSNGLHLVMSLVMLLMVLPATWRPLVTVVPLPVWVAVFVLSAVWFVVQAVRSRGEGSRVAWHHLSHAAMFGAMVWHLVGMVARMGGAGHGPAGTAGAGAMTGMPDPVAVSGTAIPVAAVGIPFMAYLLTAAVLAGVRVVRPGAAHVHADHGPATQPVMDVGGCHDARPAGGTASRLAASAEAAMAFGMFWMSVGLVLPLLPFLAVLRV